MFLFVISMFLLGIYLQKSFWPSLPLKFFRFRGLIYTIVLLITASILKIPLNSSWSLPLWIFIIYGFYLFYKTYK